MMWAGVIGSPIEHSLSPVIHRAAWEDLGVEGWEYRRIEQDESSLPEFISGLDESFRGLSVTMPCKQAIIPLLDAIDPLATGVGAVNTVVPSSGVLAGFNTDVTGDSARMLAGGPYAPHKSRRARGACHGLVCACCPR